MSQAPSSAGRKFVGLLLVIIAIALLSMTFAMFLRQQVAPRGGLGAGKELPPIRAEGWLNGSRPSADSLKGKVLVIDAWAHWCGPCLAEAPHLVSAYEKYQKMGVVFIGLTGDSEDKVPEMKEFLSAGKITWPCGYGAVDTLRELQTQMIPQVWVVGTDGKIRWNMDSTGALEEAIEGALSAANQLHPPKGIASSNHTASTDRNGPARGKP